MSAVLAATVLWGAGGTVAGYLFEQGVDPVELVASRTLLTALGMVCVTTALPGRGDGRRGQLPRNSLWLVVAFGLAVGAANGFLFMAIARLPVAVALVLQNLAPSFVLGWLALRGRQRLTVRVALGLAAALVGVALVVRLPNTPVHRLNLLGIALGMGAAAAVAAFSLLGAKATQAYGAVRANTYAFLVSSVAWTAILLPHGVPHILARHEEYPAILFVSLLGTLAPFALFAWGIARVGPQAGAVNISLEPVVSGILAWLWLHQALGAMEIFGGALVIAAVVYLQRHTQQAAAETFSKPVGTETEFDHRCSYPSKTDRSMRAPP
ncbi:DMT family transporter [Frankia sp. CiP3]|uniref:EamA family transporter n=1 Tax=Frankia sp. CiP3 TaxID=2880971 RepID=UPI001EF61946|nr:DMT family transporter [Frankia sp. CiP3]